MQSTNNNPAFGHIVCQPIRRLQVKPDLPDRPHVRVNYDFNSHVHRLLVVTKELEWTKVLESKRCKGFKGGKGAWIKKTSQGEGVLKN